MPKLINGVVDTSVFFNVDGLDYPMSDFSYKYDQITLSSDGVVDESTIRVGITYKRFDNKYLVRPNLVKDWTDLTDTPYPDLATLLADLSEFVGFNPALGGSDAGTWYNQGTEPILSSTQIPNTATFIPNVDMNLYEVSIKVDGTPTDYHYWVQLTE